MPVAPVVRVEQLMQTVIAEGDVRRDVRYRRRLAACHLDAKLVQDAAAELDGCFLETRDIV